MIRLACLLQIVALTTAVGMVVETNAITATALMFVGAPSVLLGVLLYAIVLRRASARAPTAPLSSNDNSNH